MKISYLSHLLTGPFFAPDDDGGGGNDDPENKKDESKPKTITFGSQEDLDAVIEARLERDRKAQRAKLLQEAKDQVKADQDKVEAEEQGNYKRLYEDTLKELETAKADLATAQLDSIRTRIGAKYGLSETLTKRLIGETEDDIEADAKLVAKEVKPVEETSKKEVKKTVGNADAGKGSSGSDLDGTPDPEKKKKDDGKRFAFVGEYDKALPPA